MINMSNSMLLILKRNNIFDGQALIMHAEEVTEKTNHFHAVF